MIGKICSRSFMKCQDLFKNLFRNQQREYSIKKQQIKLGILYSLPALALLLLFRFWPMFFGVYISFWKWGYFPEEFIGFQNYVQMFTRDIVYIDPIFGLKIGNLGQSLLVTIYYGVGTIPISLVLSFLISYFLFHYFKKRGQGVFRTIFFLPYITSQVAAIMVFKWIFHQNVGVANAGLTAVGLPAQNWTSDPEPILSKLLTLIGLEWPSTIPIELGGPSLALLIIMLFAIWSSIGFNIVILLAGLSSIPKELYDAAKVDGANMFQLMRNVTLPLVSPMLFLLLIVSVIGSFESFNAFYVFSGGEGGPLGTTMSLPLYIFRNFYAYGQVGYASALSVLLFMIIFLLTLLQRRMLEKRVHYDR
ncbi:carbohydrate ABC transporter permease [Mesobacillus stamsii]|uniref:Multiple sugar transport system permease protein n=1 Tax=Mesobacillus stamsii TaxID=225347 RepID=A0ABU0G1U2_9BACI|nr:sugar ABC transporter permease [Mesobacillus stamsii]MDQ0415781.1 multiple sugar transport system permease protein [Mesobacillus stamsii]